MSLSQTVDSTASQEPAALERARFVGRLLDDAVPIPGTRFRVGLDPILGIAPVSGDAVAAACALYIVAAGARLGVPPRAVAGMLLRVAGDFLVGSIPILGTLIDAGWKANKRNVQVIEAHLDDAA